MGDFGRDLQYGFRQLIRNPGFSLAAVLCLALGIGANSAAFSFVRSLLFQTAPIEDPDSLVRMYLHYNNGLEFGSWSYPDLRDLRESTDAVFSAVTANTIGIFSFSAGDQARRVFGTYVVGNYFDVLGVRPQLGRSFLPEEDATIGTHPVAVVTHAFWQETFGGDPNIVGRSFLLNGQEISVIGVAPENFVGNDTAIGTALWIPLSMEPPLTPSGSSLESRGSHWIQSATGRLQPGVSIDQAKAAVDAMYVRLEELYPDTNTGITVNFYRESEAALHPAIRGGFVAMLSLISAVVGFVLLLACANVAGLMIARSTARQREIGIRLALGARRGRLIRQLITESLALAGAGGALGIVLGLGLIGLVKSFEPPTELPLRIDIAMDAVVLGFTFLVTLATALVFGLAPALVATRADLTGALRDGSTGGSGSRSGRLRQALVVGQVALCMILLVAAGMVLQSLSAVRSVDLGFEPDHLITASVNPGLQGYDQDERTVFFDELRRRLLAEPGITAVGYSQVIPLSLNNQQSGVLPEGYEVPEGQDRPSLDVNLVDHGYFEAMGVPILRGRAFAETDTADAPGVVIINEAFAERFWPGDNPVGKSVQTAGAEREVVGVVPTGKYFSIGEDPKPYYYRARAQLYRGDATFVLVRTANDPATQLETLRRVVAGLDSTLPVSDLTTGYGALGLAMLPSQLAAGIVGTFAGLALLLSGVGLYGVIAFSVAQGVREIGVRMALGARPGDVAGGVVRQGMTLVAGGLTLGVAGGFLLARAASGFLYGVSATHPLAYTVAVAVLLSAALIASYLPARRATRIDPLTALRSD